MQLYRKFAPLSRKKLVKLPLFLFKFFWIRLYLILMFGFTWIQMRLYNKIALPSRNRAFFQSIHNLCESRHWSVILIAQSCLNLINLKNGHTCQAVFHFIIMSVMFLPLFCLLHWTYHYRSWDRLTFYWMAWYLFGKIISRVLLFSITKSVEGPCTI